MVRAAGSETICNRRRDTIQLFMASTLHQLSCDSDDLYCRWSCGDLMMSASGGAACFSAAAMTASAIESFCCGCWRDSFCRTRRCAAACGEGPRLTRCRRHVQCSEFGAAAQVGAIVVADSNVRCAITNSRHGTADHRQQSSETVSLQYTAADSSRMQCCSCNEMQNSRQSLV